MLETKPVLPDGFKRNHTGSFQVLRSEEFDARDCFFWGNLFALFLRTLITFYLKTCGSTGQSKEREVEVDSLGGGTSFL